MCQLLLASLGDDKLNKAYVSMAASIGSSVHKHGFGFVAENGVTTKTSIRAMEISNMAEIMRDAGGFIMAHIRLASAGVPVCDENAHPFCINGIYQTHNGTLTPRTSSGILTTVKKESVDAKGTATVVYEKRSDSLVFLETVMKCLEESSDKSLPNAITKAMESFTGKFALMYWDSNLQKLYVARGSTADLYISYLLDENDDSVGYVINTSGELLDMITTMLTTQFAILGTTLRFSKSSALEKNSLFLANATDLTKIGSIEEGSEYSNWDDDGEYAYYGRRTTYPPTVPAVKPATSKPAETTGLYNYAKPEESEFAAIVFKELDELSLSVRDFAFIVYKIYGISLGEINPQVAQHLVTKIFPKLRSNTQKKIRREIRRLSYGSIPMSVYQKYQFPWMLNGKKEQLEILDMLRKG